MKVYAISNSSLCNSPPPPTNSPSYPIFCSCFTNLFATSLLGLKTSFSLLQFQGEIDIFLEAIFLMVLNALLH